MIATTTQLPAIPDLATGLRILARLPMANPLEAHQEIDHVLESLRQTPLPPGEYLELLEQLRSPTHAIEENLARRIGHRPLPLDDSETRIFEQLTRCWQKISAAYKFCFLRLPTSETNSAIALQRSIVYQGLVIREHYHARREIAAGLWRAAHELYVFAETCGIAESPVWDELNAPGRQTHCAATYAALLLVDLGGPYGVSLRDQQLIWRWAFHWSLLTPVRRFEDDEPHPAFVINLAEDTALVSSRGEIAHETARCLDTSRLATQLRHSLQQLQGKATPAELGLCDDCTAGHCRRLLDHLAGPWGQTHMPRRFPRHPGDAFVRVGSGLDTIHYFIAGKEFAPPTSSPERSHAAYETLFAFRHMVEPDRKLEFQQERLEKKGYVTENWQVLDHSASGMRLCRSAQGRRVQHGQLLAISPAEDQPFFLAHITWLMQENAGELVAGIEALAGTPHAATVRVLTQSEAIATPYAPALLLPPLAALGIPETLIVPPDTYRALRIVEVLCDGTTRRYELMHVINAGPDYERVSFAPAPAGGAFG